MITPSRTLCLALPIALGLASLAGAQTLVEDQLLIEPGFIADDRYGQAVATSQGRIVVGSPEHDQLGIESGVAHVYAQDQDGVWFREDTLESFGLFNNDEFGKSVDIDGTLLVVGAPLVDVASLNEGAAHVFERQGDGSWLEVARLVANDGTTGDRFGTAVAISGSRVVVGAPDSDPAGLSASGSIYVFERQPGGAFNQVAKFVSPAPAVDRRFGTRVAIDGDFAVATQQLKLGNAGSNQVFVYARVAGTWSLEQSLAAPDRTAPGAHLFGADVALDGTRLLVGDPATTAGGQALLYQRSAGTWSQVSALVASPSLSKTPVGWSVSLDGKHAVIGGPGTSLIEGRAAFFLESIFGGWRELGSIEPNVRSGLPPDEFALDVDIADDVIVIGAPRYRNPTSLVQTGSAFALHRGELMHGHTTRRIIGGGQQDFLLLAGTSHALHMHWILGSASGSKPGVTLSPTITVPLNYDVYAQQTLSKTNQPPISGSVGLLDPDGVSQRVFVVPFGLNPSLAGIKLNHAYIVYDPFTFQIKAASNAVPLQLIP